MRYTWHIVNLYIYCINTKPKHQVLKAFYSLYSLNLHGINAFPWPPSTLQLPISCLTSPNLEASNWRDLTISDELLNSIPFCVVITSTVYWMEQTRILPNSSPMQLAMLKSPIQPMFYGYVEISNC